jgi:hypothetical protein
MSLPLFGLAAKEKPQFHHDSILITFDGFG